MTLDAKAPIPVEVRPAPNPAEARAIEAALEKVAGMRVAVTLERG